jgi:hypothetical protein
LRFARLAGRDAPPRIRTQKAALRAWVLIPPASIGVCRGLSWHLELPHLELHEMVGLAGFEPTIPCSIPQLQYILRNRLIFNSK